MGRSSHYRGILFTLLVISVIALAFDITPIGASAQEPKSQATFCPEGVGHWPYGPSDAVAVKGDTAFFGVGAALRVADVSSPTNPVVLSEIPLGDFILDIAISGDLLVAALSTSGVVSVDISNPADPTILDSLSFGERSYCVTIVNGHALIGGNSLRVIDLSVPSDLTVTGSIESEVISIRDIAVSGSIAVLADYNAGFHVVDVSDTSSPAILATHGDDLDRPLSVDVSGTYAYLLESHDDIVIFDISNPMSPSIVNRVDPDRSWFNTLHLDSDRLYVGSNSYLMIYDTSDPVNPIELWNDSAGFVSFYDLETVGSTLYAAQHYRGLGIFDVTNPSAPQALGQSPAEAPTGGVGLWDTYALTNLWGTGLVVFDMDDPAHPVELSRFFDVRPNEFSIHDGHVYTISVGEMTVVDLGDPSSLQTVGSSSPGGQDITVSGALALLAATSEGLRVVDISSPSSPTEVAVLDTEYSVNRIESAGHAVYVPEYQVGLHIIDVSAPSAPNEVGLIELPDIDHHALTAGEGLLVLVDRVEGTRLFDLTDPLNPLEIAIVSDLTQAGHLAINDDLLIVTARSDGLRVLDISDPSNPIPLGQGPLLTDYPVGLAAVGQLALVAEEDAGFQVFDLEACALGPIAADFTWAPVQPWVGTTVQFTDISTGGVTSWNWTFGDGESASEADPTHAWSSAGTYEVQLTATGPTGSDSVTKIVTVTQDPPETPPIEMAGSRQWVIPAAAHSPGAQGTNWVSDAVIHNPDSQMAMANVYFMKRGTDNSGTTGRLIEIPAGSSTALDDIVLDLFGENNTSGAVLIGSDDTLLITSRTYNDAATGTYGQFIQGIPLSQGAATGELINLMQLTRNDTFRTNIGWANPTANALAITIDLQDSQGTSLGIYTTTIPPFGYDQANDIFGADTDDARAVISTSTPQANYFAYASVVDNRTGDPILILESDRGKKLFIPAAAHVQGLVGTDWRTDLEISNGKETMVECTIDLLKTGFNNASPETATVSVPGNSNIRVTDALSTLFHYDGTAALGLSANQSSIAATSWTYNTTDAGTYGQFIPGTVSELSISQSKPSLMVQLSQSDVGNSGYRTNLGLLNVTALQLEIVIDLFDNDGTIVGTVSAVLKPFEHRQINRIFGEVTSAAIRNGFARVSTTTPQGIFLTYASVVDNRSGDPVFIPGWVAKE